jgi:hypothetical protein
VTRRVVGTKMRAAVTEGIDRLGYLDNAELLLSGAASIPQHKMVPPFLWNASEAAGSEVERHDGGAISLADDVRSWIESVAASRLVHADRIPGGGAREGRFIDLESPTGAVPEFFLR